MHLLRSDKELHNLNIRENVIFSSPSVPQMESHLNRHLSFWSQVAPTVHIGEMGSTFSMHYEFASLNFVNEHLYGATKIWYVF